MPSSDIDDHEVTPTKPKKAGTPRRSPAVRRTTNATPARKVPVNKAGTPNSAPARTKSSTKKVEPNPLGDFLLGRPSGSRARRKTLNVVPMEMKKSAVGRVQPPGGVKERVKQWQKASAAAVVEGAIEPPSEPDEVFLELDDESVTERDRRRIKFRKNGTQRPGRRKSGDGDNSSTPLKSVSSPKKRVVSDDHWMANKDKKSPPRTPKIVDELFSKGQTLPKDFLKGSVNPPLEKKIEDWNKRTINDEEALSTKHVRKSSKHVFTEGEVGPVLSGSKSTDRRIRMEPLVDTPRNETTVVKRVQSEGKRRERDCKAEDRTFPRRGSEKQREPSPDIEGLSKSRYSSTSVLVEEEGHSSPQETPTRPQRSKTRQRKSLSPESLADIPVGYSAFSVLDIPVGCDAATARPTKPQRQPSLSAVPRALKKVYNEGMKMVHDKVDSPRIGVNQPPSIESWLKGTSDPFIENAPVSESVFETKNHRSGRRSYDTAASFQERDVNENETRVVDIAEWSDTGLPTSQPISENVAFRGKVCQLSVSRMVNSKGLPKEQPVELLSPTRLKRSPATRNTSSPKSGRNKDPKDVLASSCSGELNLGARGRSPSFSALAPEPRNELQVSPAGAGLGSKDHKQQLRSGVQGPNSLRSHCTPDAFNSNSQELPGSPSYKYSSQLDRPAVGQHRLSTIASVETFRTSSSLTETSSELSQTTITHTTVTQNTARTSNTSNSSHADELVPNHRNDDLGLKRRLTKHSDLLSVLSLPDARVPGRTKSIRSARSIRTTRSRLATATIPDLLRELADDEVKYMRELKTLVDGVIPVLLTCVLSKSNSTVPTGLLSPTSGGSSDTLVTKPIVDMGIALERLKNLHKYIPLQDSGTLVRWASGAHKVYEDYIFAWRMGFQNIIVNLAPASQSDSTGDLSRDELPRNEDGDVLNENGERVDVAFLLKRPLVRVKYLAKLFKGIHNLRPGTEATQADEQFQDLLTKMRQRTKEEEARLEDQAACNTDATRVRDPRTLAPMESVIIDSTRQVCMKDFFNFSLRHSGGQRIDCRVEMILRDKPHDKSDAGDLLICEVDSLSRWLLFPPIDLDRISARLGDTKGELVVLIRGIESSKPWCELLTLTSTDEETAVEWMQKLGLSPIPPILRQDKVSPTPVLSILPTPETAQDANKESTTQNSASTLGQNEVDVPIGERRRKVEQLRVPASHNKQHSILPLPRLSDDGRHGVGVDAGLSEAKPRDLNEAMERAGKLSSFDVKTTSAKKHHSRQGSKLMTPLPESFSMGNGGNLYHNSASMSFAGQSLKPSHNEHPSTDSEPSPSKKLPADSPFTPKHRTTCSADTSDEKNLPSKKSQKVNDIFREEAAGLPTNNQILKKDDEGPPPPPHRVPSSAVLIKSSTHTTPTSAAKNGRYSSPLKNEYQPSDASSTSSVSDESDSGEFGESSESSEEELEAVDPPLPPDFRGPRNRVSPAGSYYSLPSASLVPSNSASQALFRENPQQTNIKTTKLVAAMSCWSAKGCWVDLHPNDCTVVVSPGLIEAFIMSDDHSSSTAGNDDTLSACLSDLNSNKEAGATRPLVALELTPVVPLRQSNALDIEIRSPPTARSSVECTHTIRFRSRTFQECSALYAAIHKARLENPVYKKLEQERIVSSYGRQSLQETAGGNRRRGWFARSKSYRASTRAPSVTVSEDSIYSFASTISRLRKMGGIGAFNIAKSSVDTSQSGPLGTSSGTTSVYTGSSNSAASGITPPRTPSSPSTAMTGTSNATSLGSSNIEIRLYLHETITKWNEIGRAFLTVTHPPRGMRQASSLYHGVEKRIIVTRKQRTKRGLGQRLQGPGSPGEEQESLQVVLDVVLGGRCFSRLGRTGIVMNVWEDIVGDNGEVGKVAAVGGVSGRTRKWMFHCASGAATAWVFALVGGGVR